MSLYRPPRNILLLGLTSFLNDLSGEMVLAVFPAFFISVLKTGAGSLGLVEGVADAASNLIKIYAGRLSDHIQKRKPFIVIGYVLAVAIRPVYMLAGNVLSVLGLRFLDRVGKGLREGPRDAVISLSTRKEDAGVAFGFHRAMDTLGAIVGPLIAYVLLKHYPGDFNKVFLTAFVLGIFAVLSTLFVNDVVGQFRKKNISLAAWSGYPKNFKRYLVALFFLSMGSIPIAVLLLKTQHIPELTLASIPLFYMLYNVSYAAFSMTAGSLSDKYGAKNIIRIGYLVLLFGYTIVAFADSAPLLILGFLVLGFFPALTDGVQRAFASTLSPEEKRSGAFGLVNATSGFGLMGAGIFGGYLWQHVGVSVALLAAAIFVVLGIAILSSISPQESGA